MKIWITGSNGALGKALISFLETENIYKKEIFLTDITPTQDKRYYKVSLEKKEEIIKFINEYQISHIFHLAGSFSNQIEIDMQNNVTNSLNIIQAIEACNPTISLLLIGSAAEYGMIQPNENPIPETHILNPVSIYGLTKALQTQIFEFYAKKEMNIFLARIFNLLDKNISDKLLVGKVHNICKKIQNKELMYLELGNLESQRDYISTKEAAKMLFNIIEKGKKGEVYNVGSGKPIMIKELVKNILDEYNLDFSVVKIKNFSTKYDVPSIYADIQKYQQLFLSL
jgi:GDP-4-dehydro-6-deoxy-D-mannose reductase